MITNQELSDQERERWGLPAAGCCCQEHPHRWYERTDEDGATWLECNACGDQRDPAAVSCERCGHQEGDHDPRDGCGACAMAMAGACHPRRPW